MFNYIHVIYIGEWSPEIFPKKANINSNQIKTRQDLERLNKSS